MQILTDHGMDLAPEQLNGLKLSYIPLRITLDGKTYNGGEDFTSDEFYAMLGQTQGFPTTSQPSPGEFADLYRTLSKSDPDILSIHVSSGLSGTVNAARLGAEMVPEARVTLVDSQTLSCPFGWQVQAAAHGIQKGWSMEKILSKLKEIRAKSEGIFTLASLRYLIHGGRISHIKGLLASMLNIKPIIGVEKEKGKYYQQGQAFTLKDAIVKLIERLQHFFPQGTHLRVQPLHGHNPDSAAFLVETIKKHYPVSLEPLTAIAPVLGAHTGPSIVGCAVGPMDIFEGII